MPLIGLPPASPKIEVPSDSPKPTVPSLIIPPTPTDIPPPLKVDPAPKPKITEDAAPPKIESAISPGIAPPPIPMAKTDVAPVPSELPRFDDKPTAPPLKAVSAEQLPPLKFINTRDVAFKYEITKQGTSGIQAVELWMTEDDGKTWEMFVRQEGDRSPIRARLRGEGVFGFRLVLVNGNGHRCGEPKPGQAPAMRAELDLTLPHVRIDAVDRAKANDGVLDMRWTVSEKNFDDASCSPEWSEDGREWRPIADAQKNAGSSPKVEESAKFGRSYAYAYGWKLPEKMPTKVWLRVRCKDLAGNEAEYRWPSKVSADLVDPSGGLSTIEESRDGSMRRLENSTTPFPEVKRN